MGWSSLYSNLALKFKRWQHRRRFLDTLSQEEQRWAWWVWRALALFLLFLIIAVVIGWFALPETQKASFLKKITREDKLIQEQASKIDSLTQEHAMIQKTVDELKAIIVIKESTITQLGEEIKSLETEQKSLLEQNLTFKQLASDAAKKKRK